VTIISEIWNLRNKVVFKCGLVDAEEIFCLAQLKVWLWFKFKLKRTIFSYSDWHLYPMVCLHAMT